MVYGGVNAGALSWTADSRHVAFIAGMVRLLDTRAAGSKRPDRQQDGGHPDRREAPFEWRGAVITPDGRTVFGIEELGLDPNGPIREHLVSWSAATGRQTAVLNNLHARKLNDFEQILYTSDDGSVLVLTYQRPGAKAAIVHDGRSPPPWSPYIAMAAW